MIRHKSKVVGQPVSEGEEAKLHRQIWDECTRHGWLVFHGAMSKRTHRTKGEPDFIICADKGRTIYVECKTKTGKLSPDQAAVGFHLESLGHEFHVVRSLSQFLELSS